MKKIAIFFFIIVIIIAGITYWYYNYKIDYFEAKRENKQFESYEGQEVYGTDIATLINKAIDNNESNKVEKDTKGRYIDNNENSIKMDIKMTDNDETYPMEILFNGGMERFVQYYSQIKFKCTKIEYHTSTNKIKYVLFEQITQ